MNVTGILLRNGMLFYVSFSSVESKASGLKQQVEHRSLWQKTIKHFFKKIRIARAFFLNIASWLYEFPFSLQLVLTHFLFCASLNLCFSHPVPADLLASAQMAMMLTKQNLP